MNKKLIPLCFLPIILVGCNSNSSTGSQGSQESSDVITDFSSYVCTDEDYQHLFDAAKLKDNNDFTGYRLDEEHRHRDSQEIVYRESKYVFIDRKDNYCEVQKIITKISSSPDSVLPTVTTEEHTYYDQGSTYELQEDNSYKQIDGTVSRSSLMFKFNPTKDSFENIVFTRYYNVYYFSANVVSSKANQLFGITGTDQGAPNLANMSNFNIEINVLDVNLSDISYNYVMNGKIDVSTRISIFYDPYTVVLPRTR